MEILLTGGAGFIGSHTAIELLDSSHEVIIVDNFCNSSKKVIDRIRDITGKEAKCYDCDVRDAAAMDSIMRENNVDSVIHFAGLKAVAESKEKPLHYYNNNLEATLTLLKVMAENGVNNLIFSSSATVYGEDRDSPLVETMGKGNCSNPYGWTKFMSEQIITDFARSNREFSAILLRYFNPVGAHPSGNIGEDPKGIPNNLMPYVAQVAIGKREKLTIFGNDYDTPDGTCQRDFIHVVDLAKGHKAAIDYVTRHNGIEIFNLGAGNPNSVLELVNTFMKVSETKVPYIFGSRRPGDLPVVWADVTKAKELLGWEAEFTLEDMCYDTWRWQSMNPDGIQ